MLALSGRYGRLVVFLIAAEEEWVRRWNLSSGVEVDAVGIEDANIWMVEGEHVPGSSRVAVMREHAVATLEALHPIAELLRHGTQWVGHTTSLWD